MNEEWLANLKAGDEVIVEQGYSYTSLRAEVVERITKTQVVVGRRKYSRSGGWLIGRGSRTPERIVEPTQEAMSRLHRQEALRVLKTTNWERLPTETLLLIHGLLSVPTP